MADNSVIFYGVSIEPEHINTYVRPPEITLMGVSIGTPNTNTDKITSSGSTSKKIYFTNKGNIMINPNDTILIEI
jgi:hypothetical protein